MTVTPYEQEYLDILGLGAGPVPEDLQELYNTIDTEADPWDSSFVGPPLPCMYKDISTSPCALPFEQVQYQMLFD